MSTTPDDSYADYMGTAPDPVAVHVVATVPLPVQDRPTRAWSAGQVTINSTEVRQLAPANPARARLRVKARSTNTGPVFIGADPSATTPTAGYPVDPGEYLTLTTRHAIYALATTDASVVSFVAEHLDG